MSDTAPPRPRWLTSLFSNRDGRGDSIVIAGLMFAVAGILFEGWNVIVNRQPFGMLEFGGMSAQLLAGIGGGVGGREFLTNRTPGGAPPGS